MKVSRTLLTRKQIIAHNQNVIRVIKLLKASGHMAEANALIEQYITVV